MDRALSETSAPRTPAPAHSGRVALVDLLDRLLAGGVVIVGDVTISIADVDLVRVSLRAIIASIRPEIRLQLTGPWAPYSFATEEEAWTES
ncbi:MAG TPA: gas vesicle protein GvpJ [Actinoallomurus sp.]|nr:gas vesicle protein GvpJ [Actinoallomurus sp.]